MIVITGDGVQGIHPPSPVKDIITSHVIITVSLLTQRIPKVKKNQSGQVQVSAIHSTIRPSIHVFKEGKKEQTRRFDKISHIPTYIPVTNSAKI